MRVTLPNHRQAGGLEIRVTITDADWSAMADGKPVHLNGATYNGEPLRVVIVRAAEIELKTETGEAA